jgi:hypothetical protein
MPRTIKRKPIEKVEGFHFDPVAHVYTLDGRPLHGVTSILKVINKPALLPWSAKCTADWIREHTNKCDSGILDQNEYYLVTEDDLCEAVKAHTKKKEDAGAKGSDVHEQIEELVKRAIEQDHGKLFHVGAHPNAQVDKFIKWSYENQVTFLESEKRVYSTESWYAGTLDLVLEMDGKKYIADVKTSSGIYPEFYLQMAAYQSALEEMGEHTDIAGAMVINLPKKGGFEIGYNYDYAGNRMAFLAALVLHKQLNALK